MALPGEINRENSTCPDCGQVLFLQVLQSAAGYYIGTFCDCGPYSRESDYFYTQESAEAELKLWVKDAVRPSGRDTGYHGEPD